MNDLVQRLRATADTVATTNHSAWFLYTQTADRIEALTAKAEALAEALRPFSRIEPSGFYAEDGSEAEAYIAVLAGPADGEFTGEDLATARAALKAWEK